MKKYYSILSRVSFIERKYGINYAKPDGKLFKTLNIFNILVFAYYTGVNLLLIMGMWLRYSDVKIPADAKNFLYTVIICSSVSLLGFILTECKLYTAGTVISFLPLAPLFITYAREMSDSLGFLGYKPSFYYRHAIPIILLAALNIFMFVITLRAQIKQNKLYKKILDGIYTQYHSHDGAALTDEEWESIIENYDPRKK